MHGCSQSVVWINAREIDPDGTRFGIPETTKPTPRKPPSHMVAFPPLQCQNVAPDTSENRREDSIQLDIAPLLVNMLLISVVQDT